MDYLIVFKKEPVESSLSITEIICLRHPTFILRSWYFRQKPKLFERKWTFSTSSQTFFAKTTATLLANTALCDILSPF
jgi:hypothetical protein